MATLPSITIESPTPQQVHTLNDLLKYYEREYGPSKALTTQYQLRRIYIRLRTAWGWMPLTDITPAFLRQWRDDLSQRVSPGTVRRYWASFAAPFSVAVQELEWIASNPFTKVRKPPEPAARVRFLSEDERTALLAACQVSRNPHLYSIVLLALSTGARKTQLLQLRWRDLDFTRGMVRVGSSKRTRPRILPLLGPVVPLLQHQSLIHPPEAWVFPRADGRKPSAFDAAFRSACTRAGILDFRFHDLRHTAASYLAMSGASLRDIQEILGHTTPAMSAKYTHLTTEHTAGVLQRMVDTHLTPQKGNEHV